MLRVLRPILIALSLFAAACSSSNGNSEAAPSVPTLGAPVQIDNHGGDLEGHTPTGFAGSGTGLFAGDDLNANFPPGVGIQIWLTFDLDQPALPTTATLTSDALQSRGTPFADLGPLLAEPVTYEAFSRDLWDLSADGAATTCELIEDSGVTCDVTEAVTSAAARGETRFQFRLLFTTGGDSDGETDLARFFRTDANTNEPGIFTLELA